MNEESQKLTKRINKRN